ncbi:MAG: hypothetical protein HFACDABA_02080 [Anaerolineales bacterium]|nr:hypothetical protein [Anaerolineales bacterium]
MPTDDITPVRQQYLDIKREHQNAILFFRLGGFHPHSVTNCAFRTYA